VVLSLPFCVPSVMLVNTDSDPKDREGEAGRGSKPCLGEGRKTRFKADASKSKRMSYLEPKKVGE